MSLSLTEPVTWKADEEKENTRLATKAPECMTELQKENPGRQPLTETEWKEAEKELIQKNYVSLQFPRTTRLHTDPMINGQTIGLISFIPSKNAVPDNDGCYGVLKLRGNFDSVKNADVWAENLIRNHDSYAVIDYGFVGKPFPLMKNNEMYVAATREIDVRRKVDDVVKDDLRKKRENEKREMEEVQERHKQLLKSVEEEKESKFDDLDFYVQLRTKKAHLKFSKDEMLRKINDIDPLVDNVTKEIEKLDEQFPEYKEQFMSRYQEALTASGIKAEDNPLIKYML